MLGNDELQDIKEDLEAIQQRFPKGPGETLAADGSPGLGTDCSALIASSMPPALLLARGDVAALAAAGLPSGGVGDVACRVEDRRPSAALSATALSMRALIKTRESSPSVSPTV